LPFLSTTKISQLKEVFMSREQIIAAIQTCARKLKRIPTRAELKQITGISYPMVRHGFGNMSRAFREAGLEPTARGQVIITEDLLLDWAQVARKLRQLPGVDAYERIGRYTRTPFFHRYQSWLAVPAAFRELARKKALEEEWKDVLGFISAAPVRPRKGQQRAELQSAPNQSLVHQPFQPSLSATLMRSKFRAGALSYRRTCFRDRPLAGPPLEFDGLMHEPVNELGVVFFFGMFAHQMGFRVLSIQKGFPDCEAMREVQPGKWQRVRIEFEYESRNFYKHRHSHKGCDVIVCWRHNWKECPRDLEVIELCRFVR
jgi:hypothetical protein